MLSVPRFLRLGKWASRAVVIVYILITLFLRFVIEGQLQGFVLLSLLLGGIGLLFLWALIKVRVLNPGWIGADSRD